MADSDQQHWDQRYLAQVEDTQVEDTVPSLPKHFEPFADRLAAATDAIEIACGAGSAAVWLAQQGVAVTAYDISPVAVAQAQQLATSHDVTSCRFVVADFDEGLPPGPAVDLVLCNMFRDQRLDAAIVDRLRPGGILAIAALSEVGAAPGRFRVAADELVQAFRALDLLAEHQADGLAWIVAVKR